MKKRTLMLPTGSKFSEGIFLRDEATHFPSKKREGEFAGQTGQMNRKNCKDPQKKSE
jgi:hypothetical protein